MKASENTSAGIILIAEDDDFSYLYFEEVLKKNNYTVIRAINGKEAVEIVKKNKSIALILMDIQMPLMDGNEASLKIREIRKSIPIIAQTAYLIPENAQHFINEHCDELLIKPITSAELLSVVDQYLSPN